MAGALRMGPHRRGRAVAAQQARAAVHRRGDAGIGGLSRAAAGDDGTSEADSLTIELVPSATDDVRTLIGELDRTLSAEYPPEQRHGLALEAIFQPHIRFLVARVNGVAVGCGGVALLADYAEVKRMFVRTTARGRGVAQALLACIEHHARDAGLDLLRLETGVQQHAAMRLYERAGFRRCEAFGDYAAMPPQAVATSVFFEKRLAATAH